MHPITEQAVLFSERLTLFSSLDDLSIYICLMVMADGGGLKYYADGGGHWLTSSKLKTWVLWKVEVGTAEVGIVSSQKDWGKLDNTQAWHIKRVF